jgi:signal transduction histidine kinase
VETAQTSQSGAASGTSGRSRTPTGRDDAEKLMLLVEASGQLIESAHSAQALDRILEVATQLIDADAYAVWTHELDPPRWQVASSRSLSQEYLRDATIAITDTTPALHETLVVPDVESEPLLADRIDGYHREGIRSILVVALRSHDDEASGSITFYYRQPHTFEAREVRIAEALASMATASISMATYHAEQSRSNARLGEINRRLTLIGQCSAVLTEPFNSLGESSAEASFASAVGKMVRLLVPTFSDAAVVDVFERGAEPRRIETATVDGIDADALAATRLRDWRIQPGSDVTVSQQIMSGSPLLTPDLDDEWRRACAPNEQQYEAARRLGATSFVMCPLVARGVTIGALSMMSITERRFAPVDAAMLTEVARRTATALDTARLLDETRRIAHELAIANAAKDDFLGIVSHELRTPLTIIRGNAEILARRLESIDPHARGEAVRDIEAEGERLQVVIDNMLLLARLEQGLEPEREPLLVVRVVEKLVARHQRHNPGRKFVIEQSGSARPVSFTEGYLEQVVENLISNAEKYSPIAEPIIIEINRDEREVSIRVLDHGPGLGQADPDSLFDAFYRSDDAGGRASGLGIGLAVCKRLVTAQGGRVWAAEREGGGAEFGFALPILEDSD